VTIPYKNYDLGIADKFVIQITIHLIKSLTAYKLTHKQQFLVFPHTSLFAPRHLRTIVVKKVKANSIIKKSNAKQNKNVKVHGVI